MRNRRRDKISEDDFEERRKRRAENSEILRQIAEKFEKKENNSSFSFQKEKSNDVNNVNVVKDIEEKNIENQDNTDLTSNSSNNNNNNNNSIYARKFEVSDKQKKALEDFFSMNSNKIEYGKNVSSRREHNRDRNNIERYNTDLNNDKVVKEETVLSNLLLDESEVAIDKDEAKKIGIDSKELEYGTNIDNIDLEGKPILTKKEVLENIHDEDTKVVHEKRNILYMSLMILEVLILIIVVSYAVIRVKNPGILKYFTFIPVEKVLLLDGKKEEKNKQDNNINNGTTITEGEAKYNIKLKIAGKEYNVINNAKKISESVVLLGTRTNIEPNKQHLVIASQNVEGRLSNLEGLKKGEKITLVVNDKEYNYEIISVKKVNSDDIEKIEDKNKKELTLITNAEEGKRVVVYAK